MKLFNRVPYLYLLAVPVLSFVLGALSNQLVFIANGGVMPVQLNPAVVERFSDNGTVVANGRVYLDPRHSVMRPEDNLKPLADVINLGNNVESVGDVLLDFGMWGWQFGPIMWVALALRRLLSTGNGS